MRILVVEDDRKVASFIRKGLEEAGHAVEVAGDGAAAIERATDGAPWQGDGNGAAGVIYQIDGRTRAQLGMLTDSTPTNGFFGFGSTMTAFRSRGSCLATTGLQQRMAVREATNEEAAKAFGEPMTDLRVSSNRSRSMTHLGYEVQAETCRLGLVELPGSDELCFSVRMEH